MVSAAGTNLLANPSVETQQGAAPVSWRADDWGTSTTRLGVTNDARSGTYALTVSSSARTSGDAKWIADAVPVTAGQKYIYTDYSKASVTTQLIAAYTDASGAVSYMYLGDVQPSTNWQANSISFTVPAGKQQVRILHILGTAGTLTTDDFSLTAEEQVVPPPASSNNMIANPSMEASNGSAPAGWQSDSWGTNTARFTYPTNDGRTGTSSASVQISNYTDGDAKWYFTPVSVQPNTAYNFSDYYKSTATTHLVVRFDDGAGNYTYSWLTSPALASSWTQLSASFTTPAATKYATVLHVLAANGSLQMDDVVLKPAVQTTPPPVSTNSMPNPSFETANPNNPNLPDGWQPGGWGTNSASYSYLTGGHTGSRSAKVQINSYTNGAAYWRTAAVPVTGGQLYDFTDYYQSDVSTEIDATIIMKDGSYRDVYLGTAFKSPDSWTKYQLQFMIPAGAASIIIYHVIYSVGYVTTDDYSLSPFSYQGFDKAMVSITNDDGFASLYTNGLPVLQKYGVPMTAYALSSYIDAPKYMTTTQLKSLAAAGIEIGSHSVDHADLTQLSATAQDAQLRSSQTTLQNLLGLPVTNYAAPYGAYNQQIVSSAQKYYQSYRGVQSGYNARNNFDIMNLRVQNVESTTAVSDIQNWLQQAAVTKTWLILVYHEIDANPVDATHNTMPANFDAQMAAVKNSGLTLKTVSQALAELKPQL
jgi:hypothetical protein